MTRLFDTLYLDPILGFILPGAGDVLGAGAGLWTVVVALRARAPKIVVARMLINLAIDLLVGAIPIVGDVFDVWFKANQRNLALLERRVAAPTSAADGFYVVAAALLFATALALPIVILVWALRQI